MTPAQLTRKARAEALQTRTAAFLALHGYTATVEPGTYYTSRHCATCGRAHEVASKSYPGGQGLWVFFDEGDLRWRVEIRRARDRHHKLTVRDGERCPVLAFALADLPQPTTEEAS